MRRHTGDYLLGTMFLAAALILQLSQAHVHSAAKSSVNRGLTNAAVNGLPDKTTSSTPLSPLGKIPPPSVNAVLTNLPRGTRIVVGSLDLSGGRHQIRLTSRNDGSSNANSLVVARFTHESIARRQTPETLRSLSSRTRSARNRQFVQTAAFELQPEEATLQPSVSNAAYRRTTGTFSRSDGLVYANPSSPTSTIASQQSSRMFLLPHFSNSDTIHQPGECRAIREGQRVQIYVDQRLPQAASPDQMEIWSDRLISAVELKALPIVEKWIGPVSDIDRNEKLSVVVTDLDQHGDKSAGRSPIFGCIRESDFCPESDFCGDIVYIDQSIFELPLAELHGLLTHEIAHAAICSLNQPVTLHQSGDLQKNRRVFTTSTTTPIPPWLNEAVAHFIELQCSDEAYTSSHAARELFTENFQRRIDAFLAGSGGSPIVASEHVLNLEERRSGSRGAATLFLAPLISTPHDLHKLLRSDEALEDRIEDLAQHPFSDVFRSWTLAIASNTNDTDCLSVEKIDADFESKYCSLLGTAFHCFECSDDIATLVLTSDEFAELQLSIIEPAVRDAHIAHSMR